MVMVYRIHLYGETLFLSNTLFHSTTTKFYNWVVNSDTFLKVIISCFFSYFKFWIRMKLISVITFPNTLSENDFMKRGENEYTVYYTLNMCKCQTRLICVGVGLHQYRVNNVSHIFGTYMSGSHYHLSVYERT